MRATIIGSQEKGRSALKGINVVVDLSFSPDHWHSIIEGLSAFREQVLREEEGSWRFDIVQPPSETHNIERGRLIVNQLYADMDARRSHERRTDSNSAFKAFLQLLNVDRVVTASRLSVDYNHFRQKGPDHGEAAGRTIIQIVETRNGSEDAFIALMREHARRTMNEKSACLRFEVTKPLDDQDKPLKNMLMLTELYAAEGADAQQGLNMQGPIYIEAVSPLLRAIEVIRGGPPSSQWSSVRNSLPGMG